MSAVVLGGWGPGHFYDVAVDLCLLAVFDPLSVFDSPLKLAAVTFLLSKGTTVVRSSPSPAERGCIPRLLDRGQLSLCMQQKTNALDMFQLEPQWLHSPSSHLSASPSAVVPSGRSRESENRSLDLLINTMCVCVCVWFDNVNCGPGIDGAWAQSGLYP